MMKPFAKEGNLEGEIYEVLVTGSSAIMDGWKTEAEALFYGLLCEFLPPLLMPSCIITDTSSQAVIETLTLWLRG